ncbi:5-(carboxyamino)imidazole ribonucleotide synthase [Corynebacterium sp. 153RC1]|uniref:5-(carboxyamino)imidazole ribonucleotide synthase n=1 Tax=unclassified Corynebacterium TaxID=2624378 RepID=UPI00211BED76|nr:5-(carboxyamino)imidazole ribonucleotide synthase [Corynebacterium sp. 209RC1]MCQ9354145.1 5-(carboxyamino)imidazole ribonucleotide synthase [Corynebacterium sp. 1222RC1]MCQ9356425.1 5-(carboxyamino)imidazole ribonucleotide synthase [Corynebacterium sp. 122RC1]MCQ9358527.1 5-(carboxyamino)imidazole ribonucleotide synthase [Corynebacterium sp. 142RC1]MCQ9361039.1 5-(carboxyamino)imidazole ribonucleotide synthase [Corynebacterium sp. 153RC1]MCQ9363075.1 5-(carboxyamino)imidazole ribonucleotid
MAEQTSSPHPSHAQGMPIVAVIGDGQLARMMHTEAIELGLSVRLLAGAPDASAAQVTSDVLYGDYTNLEDLQRAAQGASAFTFDHEHVPNEHLEVLIAQGINVQPQPAALVNAQDKLVMRERLAALGAPVPTFAAIDSVEDARQFFALTDGAVCLKARRGGYDGNGVWFPESEAELVEKVTELLGRGVPLMAERKVRLVRELSAMVARTPSGQTVAWPVVESVQTGGICTEAVAPAPNLPEALMLEARDLAQRIATELGVTGALAVELFETEDEHGQPEIWVNELAMRPHNTGHWTQDGCVTSQFEQHLRAVLDWPLGSTEMLAPVTVMANVLGAPEDPDMPMPQRMQKVWEKYPNAKIHLYGKNHRAGRKIGHVNMVGQDADTVRAEARDAAHFLVHAKWQD